MKLKILAFLGLIVAVASLSVILSAAPTHAKGETYKWLSAERIEGTNGILPGTSAGKSHNGVVTFIRDGTSSKYIGVTKEDNCNVKITITVSENNSKGDLEYLQCSAGRPFLDLDKSFTIANTQNGPSQNDGSEVPYATVNCNSYYSSGTDLEKNRNRCEAVKACILTANKQKDECLAAWNTCEKSYLSGFSAANQKFCRDKVAAGQLADAKNPAQTEPIEDTSRCAIEQIGWIVCPVTWFLSKLVDAAYTFVTDLLEVSPLVMTGESKGIYDAWVVMRNFSNVAFVIVFMIIIFSQISSVGVSNYGIKKMLPRLIIAAILVNISYWICAIAVDLSNITGGTIYDVLGNVKGQIVLPNINEPGADGTGWEAIAGSALVVGVGGLAVLYVTLSALLPALVTALFAIVTVFLVLTLRQALIILLIVIAPLAFVAYLLPNTEGLFTKWRKLLQTLLLMYPIIAFIFGASALASKIVMATADSIPVKIMGALVAILPLAITPVVMKTAGGLLGKFGAGINNPNKGPFDRLRKKAEGQRDKRQDIAHTRRLGGTNMFRATNARIRGDGTKKGRAAAADVLGMLGNIGTLGTSRLVQKGATGIEDYKLKSQDQADNAKKALAEEKQGYRASRVSDPSDTNQSYAKSIAGPTGNVEDVIASAQDVVRKEHIENVQKQRAKLRSEGHASDDLVRMAADDTLSQAEREAAMEEVGANGRVASVMGLTNLMGDLGRQRAALSPADRDGAEGQRLRDLMQTASGAIGSSKGKPKVVSGSSLEAGRSGTFTGSMDTLMDDFLLDGKAGPEAFRDMDIDESRHLEDMVANNRLTIPQTSRDAAAVAIETLTGDPDPNDPTGTLRRRAHPTLSGKLQTRDYAAFDNIRGGL